MTAAIRASTEPIRKSIGLLRQGQVQPLIGTSKGLKAKVQLSDLIERVASRRDREAFKNLFEYFAPRIKGFLLKTGCAAEEAEEIAQGTMVAVWRKASQFDPATTGAAAWIFTIARNLRIDAARRATRDGRLEQEVERDYEPAVAESPDMIVSRAESASRVIAAIDRLSAEQSTVIRLSFLEERPHSEIADLLGIPLGTVKSRIRLAMNRLREILDENT